MLKEIFCQKSLEANKMFKVFYEAYMIFILHFIYQKAENLNEKSWHLDLG
jgi:hypothetical protein